MRLRTFGTLSVVSALVILAACQRSGPAVNVNPATGEMHVETSEGSVTMGSQKLPDDWPSDAPVYPGATIQYTATANAPAGGPGSMVILMTTDSVEKVSEYYTAQIKAQGWNVEGTMKAQGTVIMGAKKGDRVLSLTMGEADGKTTITLGVGTGQ
jgi:hypothetical protein